MDGKRDAIPECARGATEPRRTLIVHACRVERGKRFQAEGDAIQIAEPVYRFEVVAQEVLRLIEISSIQFDHSQIAQCPGLGGLILDAPCQLQAFGVERRGEFQISFSGCNEAEPGEGERLTCRLTKFSKQPEALLTGSASTLALSWERRQEQQDVEQHVGN